MSGTFTEQDIRDWMRRHNLGNCMSTTDAGCAMGDAASIHVIDVPSRIADLESQLATANDAIDAQKEAVMVLAELAGQLSGLVDCETWCDARKGGHCKCGTEQDHEAALGEAKKNPIAEAAIDAAKMGGG